MSLTHGLMMARSQPMKNSSFIIRKQNTSFAPQRQMSIFGTIFGGGKKEEGSPVTSTNNESKSNLNSTEKATENSARPSKIINLDNTNQKAELFKPYPLTPTVGPMKENMEKQAHFAELARLWKKTTEDKTLPDTVVVAKCIEFAARNNNQDQLMSFIRRARDQSVPFTEEMYTVIIQHFYFRNNWVSAEAWLEDMKKEGFKHNTVLLNGLIKTYKRCKMYGKAGRLLNQMIEDNTADAFSYTLITRTLISKNRTEKWKENIDRLEKSGLELSELNYLPVLHFYASHKDTDQLIKWYERMKSKGIKPTERTYNILLRRIIWTHQTNVIYEWLKKMDEDGVKPTHLIYRDLIWHSLNMGDKLLTVDFVKHMDERGVKRDSCVDGRLRKMKLLFRGQLTDKYMHLPYGQDV